MCDHCGCGPEAKEHADHGHAHGHEHAHGRAHGAGRVLEVRESALAHNDRLAERNRGYFRAKGIRVLNLLSSPGSGKTALLERTFADCAQRWSMGVIVGDLQTENDANRLRARGAPAVQITTGTACHLDAHMVAHALDELGVEGLRLLFIENVGNLVCPALFDLGEDARVVLLSVTEGEDKPLKYPTIFQDAGMVVITKSDLAAAVDFDRAVALRNLRQVAPRAEIIEVSSKTGAGMEPWYQFLARLAGA